MLSLSVATVALCGPGARPLGPALLGVSRARQCRMASVSGMAYSASEEGRPAVRLFTKEGCTLCDKVKDLLLSAAETEPHSLEAVDITDADKTEWWDKYKYDIPVLHIDGQYWAKHRLSRDEALAALAEAREGPFSPRRGEPDAARLERPKA